MNVLVVGANGQVAKEAIKELKDTDHKTFAMIRNNEQAQSLKELGADEVVLADLRRVEQT